MKITASCVGFVLDSIDYFSQICEKYTGINFTYSVNQFSLLSPKITLVRGKRVRYINRSLEVPAEVSDDLFLNPFGADICIILQGPIGKNERFLKQTIERYKHLYPQLQIILSTWNSEDTVEFEKIVGLLIIKSQPPSNFGPANINLQLVSTQAGIKMAQEIGASFVIKSRTDQVLMNPMYLRALSRFIQSPSLVVSSLNTFCFRKYSISDMFMFGKVSEVAQYWDIPLDERDASFLAKSDIRTWDSWSQARLAENYLSTKYLESKGLIPDYSFKQYFNFVSTYFQIVDAAILGQTWTKYTRVFPISNPNNFPNKWSEITSTIWDDLPIITDVLVELGQSLDSKHN